MSCPTNELKDYVLGELSGASMRELEAHVHRCHACQAELDQLQLTTTMLGALRDEEPPQRVAFVSDKVFAPSWWQRLWHSGPAMGFASAAVLAAAILVHGATRPVPVIAQAPATTAVSREQIRAEVQRQVSAQIAVEVQKAVAAYDARRSDETKKLVLAATRQAEQRLELDYKAQLTNLQEVASYSERKRKVQMVASNDTRGAE